MTGTFFAVVGPSGAGKDTLIDFARAALDGDRRFAFPKRVITRAEDAGGEDHITVTPEQFREMKAAGGFLIDWDAHGLSYGIPSDAADLLETGVDVVANLSRAAIEQLCARVERVIVVHVTARLDVLANRLSERGREAPKDIKERLERAGYDVPDAAPVVTIENDASVEQAGGLLVRLLMGKSRSQERVPES